MKYAYVLGFGFGAMLCFLGIGRADDYVVSTNPAVVTSTMSVVPVAVPTTVILPAVVQSTAPATVVTGERDGDWYVVRGTLQLDRPQDKLRVIDSAGNMTELTNSDNVQIYRRGEPVSYMDANSGDYVTVRYKA